MSPTAGINKSRESTAACIGAYVVLFVVLSVLAVPFPGRLVVGRVRRLFVYALARYVHGQLDPRVRLTAGVSRRHLLLQLGQQLAVFVH